MRRRPFLHWSQLLAVLLLFASGPRLHAWPAGVERGFPLIRAVVPENDEAGIQNFGLAIDRRGVLYTANLGGVAIYDGAWWQVVSVGDNSTAFSVAIDASGRVAAGGIEDLGLLEAAPGGGFEFVSLLEHLPENERDLGQVAPTLAAPWGFVFFAEGRLLSWDGAQLDELATLPEEPVYPLIFKVRDEIYAASVAGIERLTAEGLVPFPGGELFRGRRIDQLLPAEGGLLVSVREEGLFLLRGGEAAPFAPEASRWAAEHRVFSGTSLPDGRWVLGSILGGVLLLRTDGEIDRVIDSSVGLGDDLVYGLEIDHEGALWLALNTDLARIGIASPLAIIDRRSGLEGSVYNAVRHQGALWAATAEGLFKAEEDGAMEFIEGIKPSAWSLLSLGEDLLVGTAAGVYRLRGEAPPELLPWELRQTAYALAASPSDPERFWVGTERGLLALRREGEVFRRLWAVELGSPVRSIVEGEGTLWCGTEYTGLYALDLPVDGGYEPEPRRIGEEDWVDVFRLDDRIMAVVDDGLRWLDETAGELVEDSAFAEVDPSDTFNRVAQDARGNLWLDTSPPTVFLARGEGWSSEPLPLLEVTARSIEAIVPDGEVVWLAGDNGLTGYAGDLQEAGSTLSAPLLSRVTTGGGEVLFSGLSGAIPKGVELASDLRRLRIAFAPLSFRPGLTWETRLDPLDGGWNEPIDRPFTELTRLPPGDYTFRVRTRGAGAQLGPETAWSFRVRPPWYLTPWALVAVLALALGGVRGYVFLRGRALSQRAVELEARVDEQTVALRQTVEKLQRTQAELEEANLQLKGLSLQDELTGVANRRQLQKSLMREWSLARRHARPIAFILLDLDHFKLLNDTRGHSEGDDCLRAVARHLDRAVKRRGDLLVRYGGEEFAVLLPETDLEGALRVAEELREGLEELALPHEAAPLGRVTASLGVAATIPVPGESMENLIEAADLALYRAKTEGRNRVRPRNAEGGDLGRETASN